MDETLQKKMASALRFRAYRHFYRPDGIAPVLEPGIQLGGWERLLFVLSGTKYEKMSLHGKVVTVPLEAGDAYLIGKSVWEYADMANPHELLCIVPRASYLRISYYAVTSKTRRTDPWPQAVFHHTNVPPSDALLCVLQALQTAPDAAIDDLLRAALRVAEDECTHSAASLSKALVTYERIQQYVEANFTTEITRESVAGIFGLNPSYLSQLFRGISGGTFSDYLSSCRIRYAKQILAGTEFPIKQIALLCGYSAEVYFIRRFREIVGLSPGRYRERQRSNSGNKPAPTD